METRELGINAGLQDRVIQAYGGLVYMDFSKENMTRGHGQYEPLPMDNVRGISWLAPGRRTFLLPRGSLISIVHISFPVFGLVTLPIQVILARFTATCDSDMTMASRKLLRECFV